MCRVTLVGDPSCATAAGRGSGDGRTIMQGRITQILRQAGHGDAAQNDELMRLMYSALHDLASKALNRERPNHTLGPTAVVNEAYIKLANQRGVRWRNRAHFFGVAAQIMRRVLVDYARKRRAGKRGGAADPIALDDEITDPSVADPLDWLLIDDALRRLEAMSPRQVRIVELKYFYDFTLDETAEILAVSRATVKRDLKMARAWLDRALSRSAR